ncbi:FHA domain-containing protein [Verrucomicrobiota bacterium sgz303538]
MPTLRIKLPDAGQTTHVLRGDRITVGRRPDNIVQILDRSVSGYHAELIWEGDHYRLHDLGSTNFSFVEGQQVTEFHLRNSCKIGFGNVECDFDSTPSESETSESGLTPAQMEKDMAFLRAENQELINKIDSLQRRIDILSSARLVTGKSDTNQISTPDQVKKLTAERDELRFQMSGLKFELEKLREEVSATQRERDAARQANELLQAEKVQLQRQLQGEDKGVTQKIVLPSQVSQQAPAMPREEEDATSKSDTAKLGVAVSAAS